MPQPRQLDLFGKPARRPPRVMMHATDAGQAPGMMPGWRRPTGGYFVCGRCGHDAGWLFDMTFNEVRRGVPCPICNDATVAPVAAKR